RLILSLLRAIESSSQKDANNYWACFKHSLIGYDEDSTKADYWYPYIIGVFELLIYPFIISSGLWIGVALWLTLKTLPQWGEWKNNRAIFNRFLIGNVIVLILAFVFMTQFVHMTID
ncbi:MAG: hypothetical protein KKD86_20045, partial [Bacteroidetes bacterium]|nr:hypothetical protein [Bacteroidota bacterium]MBU1681118.1 hypothetical protein [Bacteroidota bacterium]